MASLLEDDRKVVEDHPLYDSLDRLRKSLEDVERSYSILSQLDGTDDVSEQLQDVVSHLLNTLTGTKAAFKLHSKTSSLDVASEMARLFERVRKGDFSYAYYRPLVKLVIQKASNYDIWIAVLDLITTLSGVTPTPASLPPAPNNSTPITNTSASQQGAKQTKELIDARVFKEIRGCTYRDVEGFYKKYFEVKDRMDRARDVYKSIEG
jgi:hypothetical protein